MARQYSFNDDDRPRWGVADPRPGARDGFADANLARSIESDVQRTAGRELTDYVPTNFLAPEDRITRTETVEERAALRRRMMANRPDRATEIRKQAALGQAIGREQVVSGTNTTSRRRFDTEGYSPSVSRDRSGRLVIDWSRVDEFNE